MNKNNRALIFLIKRYRTIIFCWAVLAIAFCLLLIDSIPFCRYDFFMYLYIFLCILAAFLLFYFSVSLFMAKQFKKINSILFTDCDPQLYMSVCIDIIDVMTKVKRTVNFDHYRLNLSAGLIAAGRYDEAYESLINFSSFMNSRIGKLSSIVYYNNLCSVCLKLGKTDEAKYYLDCLAGCAAALNPRDHQKYIKYVDLAQYGVNMAKGIFNNAESFYNRIFSKAASNYERAGAEFALGKVHLHFGDTSRAKEAFEYVIGHGNKLHIVEEAKEYLNQITK